MPVRGAKPKPDGLKTTRHPLRQDWVEVPDVPFVGAPRLPARKPGWPAATKRWWAAVSSMPHCVLWTPAEWQFAFGTAEIAAMFHDKPSTVLSKELRDREKVMGTTLDYRRAIRVRYTDPLPVAASEATVTTLEDYRSSA